MMIIFSPSQVNGQPAFLSFSPDSGYAAFVLKSETPTIGRKLGASVHLNVTHLPGYQILVSQKRNFLGGKFHLADLVHLPLLSPEFPCQAQKDLGTLKVIFTWHA